MLRKITTDPIFRETAPYIAIVASYILVFNVLAPLICTGAVR